MPVVNRYVGEPRQVSSGTLERMTLPTKPSRRNKHYAKGRFYTPTDQ